MADEFKIPKRALQNATFEELVSELNRRCSALVVGMLSDTDDDECLTVAFFGGQYTTLGMLESMADDLRRGKYRGRRKRA